MFLGLTGIAFLGIMRFESENIGSSKLQEIWTAQTVAYEWIRKDA